MRRTSWRTIAIACALTLVAAACGSRRTHAELLAAEHAGARSVSVGPGATLEPDSAVAPVGVADPGSVEGATGSAARPRAASAGAAGAGSAATASASSSRSPIKIAWVGVQTGVPGAVSKDLLVGLKLWVRWVNDRGGASGHPIQLSVADDGGDPARSRAKRQELVDGGVIAFVAQPDSLVGASLVDFHQKNQVPVVGGDGAAEFYYDHDMYFPQQTYPPYQYVAHMAAIADTVPRGSKVAAILCTELQSCGVAGQVYQRVASRFGLEMSYQARTTVAQPDFTSECIAARNSGATVLVMSMDLPSEKRIAQACSRQGYHPKYEPYLIDGSFTSIAEFDGLIYPSSLAPFTGSGSAGQAEFQKAVQTYGVAPSTLVLSGWASGRLLGNAIAAAGDRQTVDRPALLQGLWSLQGDDLGGLTYPLTFTKGKPAAPRTCWWALTISGGRYVASGDGQRKCTDVQP